MEPADRSWQRQEAGLWCGEVLALLPDLVDGTLAEADRAQVMAHVAACDACARFGGAYGAVVTRLRASAPEAPTDVGARLRARLAQLPDQD